ncbi:hypothetical protein [Lentzea flaviverrucosa]|uniref:Uncharacterized protein n=1 Tax=Lentzea flaviverrucosa TaxID=200379 RepID=A0A1H9V2C7_9PSEU|nr:hypothetical protein [Lentzea flaviverrucosa]RDI27598.1 hypothetical protein DFR72_10682 [Lentzea flaviverrucosa]SES15524.1 hypothetical protein SAMN05216195_109263 [Lentzea flaviverrucosa]
MRSLAALVALLLVLTGCGGDGEDRFARPGAPKPSPSGKFVAHAESASEVRVTDRNGGDVFRKSYEYATSSRADGIGVVWLSKQDQLWVLVPGDTSERIEAGPDGVWKAVEAELPGEITRLG